MAAFRTLPPTSRALASCFLGLFGALIAPTDSFSQSVDSWGLQVNANAKALGSCRQRNDSLGLTPSHIKAATSSRPWRLFDQRGAFFPVRAKAIGASEVPGGRALEIKIDRSEPFAHDIGVSILNQRPILRGSQIEARVWLRTSSSLPTTLVARLQNNEAGFKRLNQVPLNVTSQFREYVITTRAYQDYCPGTFNFALHLATGQHIIEVGPGVLIVREQPLIS